MLQLLLMDEDLRRRHREGKRILRQQLAADREARERRKAKLQVERAWAKRYGLGALPSSADSEFMNSDS